MNRHRSIVGAPLFALLAGCASLPAPGSPGDTLLVIPIELVKDVEGQPGGRIKITLVSADGLVQNVQYLSPDKQYTLVAHLPAGKYKIAEEEFIFNDPTLSLGGGHKGTLGIPFELFPGKITFLEMMLTYSVRVAGPVVTTGTQWNRLSPQVARRVMKMLTSKDSFAAWELCERTRRNPSIAPIVEELGLR
jgi:hypothetical protein